MLVLAPPPFSSTPWCPVVDARRLLLYAVNKAIDAACHPRGLWLLDFLLHSVVELASGVPPEKVAAKALRYYVPILLRRVRVIASSNSSRSW